MNESYPWVEKQIVYRPDFPSWQRAFRDSLLEAGIAPFNGFTYDHVYGTKVGGTIFDRSGRRHTAAELLASADAKKLTVLVYATVQKIFFDTLGIIAHIIFPPKRGKCYTYVKLRVEVEKVNLFQGEKSLRYSTVPEMQKIPLSTVGFHTL